MTKRSITVRLDDDLLAAADMLASATGADRTGLIARGLRRELLYDGQREFIYLLLDGAGEVRYVGRSRDPYRRMREHLAAARAGGSSAKEAWIAELLDEGKVPRLAIVDDAEGGDAIKDLEREWIARFADGGRLTNGNGIVAGVARAERDSSRATTVLLSGSLVDRIDAVRGDVPRARWVRRVVERALSGEALEGSHTTVRTSALGYPAPSLERSSSVARALRSGAHHPTCKCPVCKPPKGS